MSSATLCDWCAKLLSKETSSMGDLGPLSRVRNSPCLLCQLVIQGYLQAQVNAREDIDVYLSWRWLGGRPAYELPIGHAGGNFWIGFGPISPEQAPVHSHSPPKCILKSTTESLIDGPRILGWIKSCEQEHGGFCQLSTRVPFSEAFRGLPLIRFIDVQAACLVEVKRLGKYMALSYVWGAVPNFRLTKANRSTLLKPGSLKDVSSRLPKTIFDAIAVARHLGCRYLWVDALCLIQNDADDLSGGVNSMDMIYERAWVTIVAACGHDSNARLPGARHGTRNWSMNVCEVTPGVTMGIFGSLDALLDRSVYESRAWTFQERLLSRRIIYFVQDKLFYRCRVVEQAEHFTDIHQPTDELSLHYCDLLQRPIQMESPRVDFAQILESYTKRALTNQLDAPRAMAGIIRRFSETMRCQFLEGLPTATFDFFITFDSLKGSLRRRSAFPSYSWTGWSGQIDSYLAKGQTFGHNISETENAILKNQTWIIWYKRNPLGITSLVWDPSSNPSFPLHDPLCVGYRERRPFPHRRLIPAQLDTTQTMPTGTISFSRTAPSYHILQFWTLSVFYTISNIDVFEGTAWLVDRNGSACGSIRLDGFEETTYFEYQTCFELILLSDAPKVLYRPFKTRAYDSKSSDFHILLLEWQGGLAERRGSGYLMQDAVRNSLAPGPLWKEILLA